MSVSGFPDWQNIAQWLGSPVEQQTGRAINAGSYTTPAFELSSWAAVIVAIKAIGGAVDVTVTQNVSGGPTSLGLAQTFHVSAGATLFEAVVLFGDSVTVKIQGAGAGTSVDYAIYPSNTTTNAQVITQATINVQHNEALVAAEPTIDFVDPAGGAWTITDDAANTRVKVQPPAVDYARLAVATPAGAAVDFAGISNAYTHLRIEYVVYGLGGEAVLQMLLNNDAAANYAADQNEVLNGGRNDGEFLGQNFAWAGVAGTGAGAYVGTVDLPGYALGVNKRVIANYAGAATNRRVGQQFSNWASAAVINRVTFPQLVSGVFTLYGIR